MGRLEGSRTIVTGAASRIGRAVVDRYIAEGAHVVAVVRHSSEIAALEAAGARALVGDVSQVGTAERAVELAVECFGGLDTFVANAGLWDFHKRVEKQSADNLKNAFDELFGVNLLSTLFAARAGLSALRDSRGSIIVTASNASFLAGGGGALYTASKFALRGLVMQLAKEFAPDVRVNGVAPGATDTALAGPAALAQSDRAMNGDAARLAEMEHHIPLGRVSQPAEHASLYVLLASATESAYVTGALFQSDGGLTISV
jgi:NAD(P)-dependent dehydrogenase (short-subunit alcohol dehydrogenase family)